MLPACPRRPRGASRSPPWQSPARRPVPGRRQRSVLQHPRQARPGRHRRALRSPRDLRADRGLARPPAPAARTGGHRPCPSERPFVQRTPALGVRYCCALAGRRPLPVLPTRTCVGARRAGLTWHQSTACCARGARQVVVQRSTMVGQHCPMGAGRSPPWCMVGTHVMARTTPLVLPRVVLFVLGFRVVLGCCGDGGMGVVLLFCCFSAPSDCCKSSLLLAFAQCAYPPEGPGVRSTRRLAPSWWPLGPGPRTTRPSGLF